MTGPIDIVEIDHADDEALQSHIDFELVHEPLAEGRTLAATRRRLGMIDAALFLEARIAGQRVAVGAIHAAPHDPTSPELPMSVTSELDVLRTVGQSLYEAMCAWALRRTPEPRLTVRVDEASDAIRGFWSDMGFSLAQRYSALRIDLSAPRAEPPPAAFTIVSLADRPDLMRAAWQVQCSSWKDVPGNEQAMPPFERWSESFSSGLRPPEGAFIALDESGDGLGLTTTAVTVAHMRVANTIFTGVRADARGRGVALALKWHQIEWCRVAGYGVIETVNHEDNAAMLAINDKVGFVPYCAVLALEHNLLTLTSP